MSCKQLKQWMATVWNGPQTRTGSYGPLQSMVPKPFGTSDQFHGRQFSTDWGNEDGSGDDSKKGTV